MVLLTPLLVLPFRHKDVRAEGASGMTGRLEAVRVELHQMRCLVQLRMIREQRSDVLVLIGLTGNL